MRESCPCGRVFYDWELFVRHVEGCSTAAHRRVVEQTQYLNRIVAGRLYLSQEADT